MPLRDRLGHAASRPATSNQEASGEPGGGGIGAAESRPHPGYELSPAGLILFGPLRPGAISRRTIRILRSEDAGPCAPLPSCRQPFGLGGSCSNVRNCRANARLAPKRRCEGLKIGRFSTANDARGERQEARTMKSTMVLSFMAAVVSMLAASDGFASPRASREKMLFRCEIKYVECEDKCDKAPNTTPKKYKACNDRCANSLQACYRRVDEVNPAHTGGGGSPNSGAAAALRTNAGREGISEATPPFHDRLGQRHPCRRKDVPMRWTIAIILALFAAAIVSDTVAANPPNAEFRRRCAIAHALRTKRPGRLSQIHRSGASRSRARWPATTFPASAVAG